MKVIDIGTKLGPSIAHFLHKVGTFFPSYDQTITPSDCAGVDIDELYRHDFTKSEVTFMCGDITDATFRDTLPSPDFFLVCNILHHFSSRQVVEEIMGYVLDTAKYGVWFRIKSFETDCESGEGILLEQDLRFSWSRDSTAYTCADLFKFVKGRYPKATVRLEPGKRIRHTEDKRVIPKDSAYSAQKGKPSFYYDPRMGEKKYFTLTNSVVCDWDILVEKG